MYVFLTIFYRKKSPLSQIISARTLKYRTLIYLCILKVSASHFIVNLLYFSLYNLRFLYENFNRARA